jgi:SAM-dependent methyltransferase
MEDKDPGKFKKSLEIGRENFKEKYHGLDAWEDINNFERKLISMLSKEGLSDIPSILGIDVRCGAPILEIKNKLRLEGVNRTSTFGFTTDAKYYEDLLSICNEVYCDKIDDIQDYFKPETFDVIILGNAINYYTKPIRTLEKIIELGKPGSKILFKLKNTADVRTVLISLGNIKNTEGDMPIHISVDDMLNCLSLMKVKDIELSNELHAADTAIKQKMLEIINSSGVSKNSEDTLAKLFTSEYLFCITK